MNCTVTLTNPDGSKLFETSCSVSRTLTKEEFDNLVRQVFVALSYGSTSSNKKENEVNVVVPTVEKEAERPVHNHKKKVSTKED